MSQKITSKNLTYDSKVPKFLAALKAQASGSSSSPDPLLASRRRPTLKRSGSAEAEDAPVVVDEEGNVVDAHVSADGTVRRTEGEASEGEGKDGAREDGAGQDEAKGLGSKPAALPGLGRKRKTAKVIGGDEDDEELGGGSKTAKSTAGKTKDANSTRSKKKAKKIKLSFDEGS